MPPRRWKLALITSIYRWTFSPDEKRKWKKTHTPQISCDGSVIRLTSPSLTAAISEISSTRTMGLTLNFIKILATPFPEDY
ncbi:hypothetical protein NPIL_524591 [Nephila pilipes]|uniref:Uncharacterized protein n=1 Tax=Nephila pilipes TaxID=299642 RepID=A0A8X6QVS3_NEPPI|nr:hypothetical protein NPIL_524591 [Nephila pilipes]